MHWLLFPAYDPECRHHATHDHAKKKGISVVPFVVFKFSIANARHCMLIKIKNKKKKQEGFQLYESISLQGTSFMLFPQRLLWKSSFGSNFSSFFQLKLPSQIYLYISNASLEIF